MKYLFILKAVFHSVKHRRFSVIVSIFAISAAFAFLAAIGCVSFGLAATAVNSSLAFPLVVGPAGASDTTLVMSTLFNIDKPAGTLDYEVAEKLAEDERVAAVFPVARADSHEGIPITGVESAYINEISGGFSAVESGLKENDIFGKNGKNCAVIGSKTAARYEMKTGDTFFGSHGSVGDEDAHLHDFEYRVCAIMKAVNGPEDFAIFTSLRNVWKIHAHGHHHEDIRDMRNAERSCIHDMCVSKKHEHSPERKITAVLVQTKNPVFTAALEREYSENGLTSAADTAKTVRKLLAYMNKAEKAAGFFSYGTLFLVLTMVFVTILTSINERKREMALMRTLGIGKLPVSLMIFAESFFISAAGTLIGIISGHGLLAVLKPLIDFELGINLEPFFFTEVEIRGTVLTLAAGFFLSLAAMGKIYRMNLVEEIAKE